MEEIEAIEAGRLGCGLGGKAAWQGVKGTKRTDEEPFLSCQKARNGAIYGYGTDKAIVS